MEVRAAEIDDATGLAACIVPAWLDAHRQQIPSHLWERRRSDWTVDVSAAAWRRTLSEITSGSKPGAHVLVATVEHDIVGLVAGTIDDEGRAEVSALYVTSGSRRRGVGSRLLTASLESFRAAGLPTVRIVVLASNAPARRFYERLGGIDGGATEVDEDDEVLPAVIYRWTLT